MTTPHPCPDWRELLSAYHDHQLPPEDNQLVEAHLAECAACRATLALWEADRARFTAAYADSTAGEAMKKHILQELRTMESSSKEVSLPLGWLRWLTGLSAAAVLACVLLFAAVLVTQQPREQVVMVPTDADELATNAENEYGLNGNMIDTDNDAAVTPMRMTGRSITGVGFRTIIPPSPGSANMGGTLSRTAMPIGKATAFRGKTSQGDVAADSTFNFAGSTRNYGIPGGIKMAYDADVTVQVKDALAEGRKALQVVRDQGGFVVDFSFGNDEGERPWATLRGKVPADKAEATLAAMEKMGRVRALTIAGEDLTEQFQQHLDEIKKQNEHAEKLEKLEDKARRTYAALQAEQQRHYAKEQATQARRLLHGLAAKHDLVEFSASFVEERPRERLHFTQLVTGAQAILQFSLLLLAVVAVLLLLVGLIASPWLAAKYLRAKR